MRALRQPAAFLLALLLALPLVLFPTRADARAGQVTILFTHDMHSHFLPSDDGEGGTYGGYARLKTAIDQQRALHPGALLVDGGDFSMGSLFQAAYGTSALELRAMGAMGYDVTTFGNHEYDHRPAGLASMLNAALDSGEALPAIVEANYLPPAEGTEGYDEDSQAVLDAFRRYGVSSYVLLERGGVWFAVFGINGEDSDACAPMSGMILYDRVETAQQVVDEAKAACMERNGVQPLVVCLSHSGTDEKGRGEDYELAQKVDGIDLIVSGHTHTVLAQPIQVNDTYIVSCGEYSKNLGVITLNYAPGSPASLADYRLIPIDGAVAEDAPMASWIDEAKVEVERSYLSKFGGLTFDQVLIHNSYPFDTVDDVYATHHESTLGDLFSDAYAWAAEQATGEPVDLALTASGVIRETIPLGDVTVSDVFNAASLGIGADRVAGYPLVSVYLTGRDLKTALEVDASVSDLMPAARLYSSGAVYSYNTRRMFLNRVTEASLRGRDGTVRPIEDDELYRVVTGLYCGQMLGAVEDTSFGLLSVTPRDAAGDPIDMSRLEDYIIHNADGSEVKEWYAIASYLQQMGGEMDERYSGPDGRKTVYSSWNPVELLKNPNRFTIVPLAALLLLVLIIALVVRAILRRRPHGKRRAPASYSPYRGRKR